LNSEQSRRPDVSAHPTLELDQLRGFRIHYNKTSVHNKHALGAGSGYIILRAESCRGAHSSQITQKRPYCVMRLALLTPRYGAQPRGIGHNHNNDPFGFIYPTAVFLHVSWHSSGWGWIPMAAFTKEGPTQSLADPESYRSGTFPAWLWLCYRQRCHTLPVRNRLQGIFAGRFFFFFFYFLFFFFFFCSFVNSFFFFLLFFFFFGSVPRAAPLRDLQISALSSSLASKNKQTSEDSGSFWRDEGSRFIHFFFLHSAKVRWKWWCVHMN